MALLLPILLLISFFAPSSWAAEPPALRPLDELLEALDDANYQARRKAVLAAKGRKEKALLERLLQMAKQDPHVNIRGYVAEVLPSFEDPRIVPLLIEMAKSGGPGERNSALVALGSTKDPRAYDVLIEALAGGRIIRGYAAQGLGKLGDLRAFRAVAECYVTHLDDPYLTDMAPKALVELDRARGLAYCRARFARTASPARSGLVRVLSEHASDETRELMLEFLTGSEDKMLRSQAIEVLRGLRDRESVPGLIEAMKAHPEDRVALADILGVIGDERGLMPVLDTFSAAGTPVEQVRLMAALVGVAKGTKDIRAIMSLTRFLESREFSAQPRTTSRVLQFPWNTYVAAAAFWAIRTIEDGEEPFPRETLSRFPKRPMNSSVKADIKTMRERLAHKFRGQDGE